MADHAQEIGKLARRHVLKPRGQQRSDAQLQRQ
jgi:hypothetical protein